MFHVFARLEIRIGLGESEQASHRPGQHTLRTAEGFHRTGIAGIARRLGESTDRLIAGRNDGLERLTLMGHITFDRLDQIRDQVVSSLELHFDLGEAVLVAILEGDQSVIDADDQHRDSHDQDKDDEEGDDDSGHGWTSRALTVSVGSTAGVGLFRSQSSRSGD